MAKAMHVGQRLVRLGRSRSDHVGRGADQQHRIEILLAVVRQRRQHERICGMVVEDREPGVAVGRRFHHRRGSDAPGRSGPVLDHDRVAKTLLQSRLHQAHDGVRGSAGRVGDDDAHGAGRP